MIDPSFPRDLLVTGLIFGVAAFVWAGWGQERPPRHGAWRVVLAVISLGGLALAAVSLPLVIAHWGAATAFSTGPAFLVYTIVFWLEVIAIVVLAVWASRRKRGDLIAPLVLAVVGIHFLPLAWVFGQPVFAVTGVIVTIIAVVVALRPDAVAARSFWCGLLGGSVLLASGVWCAVAGWQALG